MTTDTELLATFARTNSEDAFAELVKRYVNLVYSAALRQVSGDEHLAQDVAQTVFTDLARKAGSLARRESLTGWLYTSVHFAAAKIIRTETRRRDREEKFMRETDSSGTGVSPVQSASELAEWQTLSVSLDAAMHELKEADRNAILLRYFENRPFAEVGGKLGLNENAARMRVERALGKLRAAFSRRGIAATATLASVISANAVQLAPASLAATLTTTAIAGASAGTFTLLKIMTATKLKLGIATLVVTAVAAAFVMQQQAQEKLRSEIGALQQQIAQLQTDNQNLSNRLASAGDSKMMSDDQFNELLKLRGEVGMLRQRTSKAQEQADTANKKIKAIEDKSELILTSQEKFKAQEIATINDMKMLGLAERIYAGDNNNLYAANFEQITNELGAKLYQKLSTGNVELLNVGITNVMDYPQMIISREIMSHQAPDGTWHRIYGLADGSVQTAITYDGNFAAWEKVNTAPPPSQNQ